MSPKKKTLSTLLPLLVIALGIFIRFYRFTDLMTFSFGQGNALNLSAQMITAQKPALISQIYSIRETPSGHSFFHSGAYLYPIAPLQLLFNYNPLPITIAFTLMNLFSGISLFLIAKKFFNSRVAFISLVLFMFSSEMVGYSRFIWHVNLLVPLSVAAIYFFLSSLKKSSLRQYLALGFLSGLGFGIHIGFSILGSLFLIWTIYQSLRHRQYANFPLFLLGGLLGNLPVVIFDLRNNFFNTGTMIEFLFSLGQGTQKGSFGFVGYHFVSLFPPLFLLLAVIVDRWAQKNNRLSLLFLVLYISAMAPAWGLRDSHPAGMVEGWSYPGVVKAASLIAADRPPAKYEIASIIDGETRSTNMRYLLTYIHHRPPLGVIDYPQAEVLYVLGRKNQDPTNYNVWEINSIKPVRLLQSWPIQNDIYLYKLTPLK